MNYQSKQEEIKRGKFKGKDRKEILALIREADKNKGKKAKKRNTHVDKSLAGSYNSWQSVTDIKRSFFIWKGKYPSSSKEAEITVILKEMNLRFFREVSFDMRKRFDFYIPLIDLVIEYDGSQHFNDLKNIENDKQKEDLLKRLGVKLIRYNKTHKLKEQIAYDLIYHPVIVNANV